MIIWVRVWFKLGCKSLFMVPYMATAVEMNQREEGCPLAPHLDVPLEMRMLSLRSLRSHALTAVQNFLIASRR